jgi:hypothetical protein
LHSWFNPSLSLLTILLLMYTFPIKSHSSLPTLHFTSLHTYMFLNIFFYFHIDFLMLADYRQGKSWHQFCAVSYGVQHSSNSVRTGTCQCYPGMYLKNCVVSKIWCFCSDIYKQVRSHTSSPLYALMPCTQLNLLIANHISLLLLPEN